MFLKSLRRGLPKKYDILAFLVARNVWSPFDNGGVLDGDQIFSITIQHTPTIIWQMKGVGHVLSFWKK
jgi:hypothetical protein